MSRATRAWRGVLGALVATILAAGSHALAGGSVTWLALIATTVLAAPLCVALAGRIASVWRLAIGVGASQLLYHWSFAGLGEAAADSLTSGGLPVSPHALHTAWFSGVFAAPGAAARVAEGSGASWVSGAAGASGASAELAMWVAHAVAAALTIALLARGERAFLALTRLIGRAVALPGLRPAFGWPRTAARAPFVVPHFDLLRLIGIAAINHRGPPSGARSCFS